MRIDLTEIQMQFAQALFNREQVSPLLAEFKGEPALSRERFAFYRGNINAIWLQSCASAYPVLQQMLGAEFFEDLTRAYGTAHPSRSGNLTEFAAAMPEFIGTLENCQDYPYLSDVAALEWLIHCSYFQQRQPPCTLPELAAIPAELLGEVRPCLAA